VLKVAQVVQGQLAQVEAEVHSQQAALEAEEER